MEIRHLFIFFIIKVLTIVSFYFVEHCVGVSETYVGIALWFEYCSVLFIFLLLLFLFANSAIRNIKKLPSLKKRGGVIEDLFHLLIYFLIFVKKVIVP